MNTGIVSFSNAAPTGTEVPGVVDEETAIVLRGIMLSDINDKLTIATNRYLSARQASSGAGVNQFVKTTVKTEATSSTVKTCTNGTSDASNVQEHSKISEENEDNSKTKPEEEDQKTSVPVTSTTD